MPAADTERPQITRCLDVDLSSYGMFENVQLQTCSLDCQ